MFKKTLPYLLVLIISLGLFAYSPGKSLESQTQETKIENISAEVVTADAPQNLVQHVEIELSNGMNIQVENDENLSANPRTFYAGDKVVVTKYQGDDGRYVYYISDYVRQPALALLFAAFIALVLAVTGMQGIGSLIGMLFSFLILFKFVLPQILTGANPVVAAIIGSIFIIPATFFLSHGVNRKTSIAVLGTILTLVITGLLAVIFANLASLSGTSSDSASYLSIIAQNSIDFKGLVLAGMIISVLGVLDDITISQSSVVQQLKAAKKDIKLKELYFRAITVGKDHIASLVNTLVLVYTGASLPMLLLFLDKSSKFAEIVNLEFIAEEIVQTLVGSIGLVLAVPITTFIACFWASDKEDKSPGCCHVHKH